MNYQKIYDDFIADRKSSKEVNGYFEVHHIIPRSLGGSDDSENLVRLTPSDHFFAHLLLAKIHSGPMSTALFFMAGEGSRSARGHKAKRWAYDFSRRAMALEKRKLIGPLNHFYGRTHDEETRKKISKSRTGKMTGEDHFAYGVPSPLRGRKIKTETKMKISKANSGRNNGMHGKSGVLSPSYKKTVFEFKNKETGEIFTGTQGELIKKFDLCFKNVSAVVLGRRRTVKGWQIKGVTE